MIFCEVAEDVVPPLLVQVIVRTGILGPAVEIVQGGGGLQNINIIKLFFVSKL